jgi:hypothetical protein
MENNFTSLIHIINNIYLNSADLLENLIKAKEITGGGIKTFVKTRWTSVHDCVASVIRLEQVLQEVINL